MNLEKRLLENMLRFGVKNLSKEQFEKISLLEQTQEQSITKRINFASGMHSVQKGNVAGVLGPELKSMQDFLVAHKGSVVEVVLSSSESQVTNYDGETNPKTPLKPGQLSQMRYETIEAYMTQWLNGLKQQNIITNIPTFIKVPSKLGSTPYKAGVDNPRDAKYTAEQWLEVTLKVTADDSWIPALEKATTSTTRNSESTWNKYNAQALFYFKSYAAAAAVNGDPNSMPGALLTMNRYFALKEAISLTKFNLPAFTMKISGGSPAQVIILEKGANAGSPNDNILQDNRDSFIRYTAYVGDSYTLTPPFKPGTTEFKNAWIFAYWYIMSTYPNDWNYISNKPTDIDFTGLQKKLTNNQKTKVFETSQALQEAWWKRYNKFWYKSQIDRVYREE